MSERAATVKEEATAKEESPLNCISRRGFLESIAALGEVACLPALCSDERPVLTVGIMSDTHITREHSSIERTRLAMELFKKLGVDVMAHVGDLGNWHFEEAYAYYREALDAVFPPSSPRPVLMYAFGNHDALEPSRRKGPRSSWQGDRRRLFADMAERLGIDHGYSDLKVIAGYPFLIFPESFDNDLTLADYERILAETCAKFPSGPVFVLEHPPAYQTTYNSCFQYPPRRAVLDKFPRVVEISGHKHASVKNELCIWQGTFTAVQTSCLQQWCGLNVGDRIVMKQSWCVCVMEVFRNRLVFRRYDVRDGVEYKPDAPWTVPLPFVPDAAPLTVAARRRTERAATFPAGAAPSVEEDGDPFPRVGVRFPTVTEPDIVLNYRVEAARRNADGEWERCVAADVFGDFYERPADRTGTLSWNFDSALFDVGVEYRFSVTPVGFFGTEGKPISCLWRSSEKAPAEIVWQCDDPMKSLKPVGDAKIRRDGEWLVCGSGGFRFDPPPEALQGNKGDRFVFVVEMQTVQTEVPYGVAFGVVNANWSGGLLTPLGDSGMVRYALTEVHGGGMTDWAFRFAGKGNLKVRFSKLWIERRK